METVADEQHYVFQTLKHSLSADQREKHHNHEIREGFFQSGLFSFCRHPNYFAEQVSPLFSCNGS
jgi:steroid 5-alpha reductase family enzyme